MEAPSRPPSGSATPRDSFVHAVVSGVKNPAVVRRYAKTMAETVSSAGYVVPWFELSVIGTDGLYTTELTAHLANLDVVAELTGSDVFLAVRDVFKSLVQKLARLRQLERLTDDVKTEPAAPHTYRFPSLYEVFVFTDGKLYRGPGFLHLKDALRHVGDQLDGQSFAIRQPDGEWYRGGDAVSAVFSVARGKHG